MKALKVLETCLYAQDLDAAERFYSDVLGLEVHARQPGRHVFFRSGDAMFLLFNPDFTEAETAPAHKPHGCRGRGHTAWRVEAAELDGWRAWLHQKGVTIESDHGWPQGGHSIYFSDPAGNSLELATPQVWGIR